MTPSGLERLTSEEERAGVRSSRGSPDACRLFGGRRTVGWAVVTAGRTVEELRRRWRAEVGPRLPGGCPLLLSLHAAWSSFERLIFAEVGDRKPQRVNGDQFVRDTRLEDEN